MSLKIILASLIACLASSPALAATLPLQPAAHGDFGHYTFALTWQPGICSTEDGCLADQPHAPLIGLHGLWASRPQSLIASGITRQQWWSRGCDYLDRSDASPVLPPRLVQQLAQVMPHFKDSLLTHEYDKHVQCFKFDAERFFTAELAMRAIVVNGSFGKYFMQHAGSTVGRADVVSAFKAAFSTGLDNSLQLQCGRNTDGHTVLTQFWITIDTARLGAFPQAASLVDSPVDQNTCPATFYIPVWR